MKRILIVLFLFSGVYVHAQTLQTTYSVTSISQMKVYAGSAQRMHVTAVNKDYILCPTCGTPDEDTLVAGAAGRKWKLFHPEKDSLALAALADTATNLRTLIATSGGAVSSVFSRTGAVTAQAGDYAAFYLSLDDTASMLQNYRHWLAGYLTKTAADALYQPIGSYLTEETDAIALSALQDTAAAIRADMGTGSGSGGTTSKQSQTAASGVKTFTFTSVPASYDDYMIFRNGVKLMYTTSYTTSGNVVTIPNVEDGDVIIFQRIK